MFGISKILQCITKGKKSGSIRKETENKPGSAVSEDQFQSARPVLVPQFSGKLTIICSWATQVTVDRFSDLAYENLMGITMQENQPLKYRMPHFKLKFLDIMQIMEDFLKNLLDKQLRIPIRQLKIGIVYHQQNTIFEGNNQKIYTRI